MRSPNVEVLQWVYVVPVYSYANVQAVRTAVTCAGNRSQLCSLRNATARIEHGIHGFETDLRALVDLESDYATINNNAGEGNERITR